MKSNSKLNGCAATKVGSIQATAADGDRVLSGSGFAAFSETTGKRQWQIAILLFAIAALLRFTGITFDSMWLDEGYQTMVDSIGVKPTNLEKLRNEPFVYSLGEPRSPEQVLLNFRQVDPLCPPLYFLILNRWITAFGTTDFAVRTLSALISLACLALVFVGSRIIFGTRIALCTLAVQAFSPYEIHYAQEARMYSLVLFTASASCLSFYFLIQNVLKKASAWSVVLWVLLYGAASWALINTHYTGLFVVAFQGLYGTAYSIKKRNLSLFLALCAGWGLTVLFWLPWFSLFRQAAGERGSYYVNRNSDIFWAFKGLFRVFANWVCYLSGVRVGAFAVPIYVTSVSLLIAGFATSRVGRFAAKTFNHLFKLQGDDPDSDRPDNRNSLSAKGVGDAMAFVVCWAVLPALIAFTIDLLETRKTIEVSRYLMGTAPAVFILAGIGASRLLGMSKGRLSKAGADGGRRELSLPSNFARLNLKAKPNFILSLKWVLAAHIAFSLVNFVYTHTHEQREPWRQMAALIEAKVPPSDLLLVSPHYNLVPLNRYLSVPRMQVGTGPLLGSEQVYKVLRGQQRFWLLIAQEGGSVSVFVPPRFEQKQEFDLSHGLHLTYWALK